MSAFTAGNTSQLHKGETYEINGKTYTEDEVIAIHAMWQDILDRNNIKECVE